MMVSYYYWVILIEKISNRANVSNIVLLIDWEMFIVPIDIICYIFVTNVLKVHALLKSIFFALFTSVPVLDLHRW